MQRQTFTAGNHNNSGTWAQSRTSERFVNVEREAYAYLLNYLYQRFGAVQRARNSFVNPAGERVALLLDADSLMVLGKGIFQAERISIAQVVKALRAKGRPRIFRTNLTYCETCQSFSSSRVSLTEHEQNGERHELRQVLTFAYPTYLGKERKELTVSKSWMNLDVLARAFATQAGDLGGSGLGQVQVRRVLRRQKAHHTRARRLLDEAGDGSLRRRTRQHVPERGRPRKVRRWHRRQGGSRDRGEHAYVPEASPTLLVGSSALRHTTVTVGIGASRGRSRWETVRARVRMEGKGRCSNGRSP